jgi:uncharacterized damage-inducible protein DinB
MIGFLTPPATDEYAPVYADYIERVRRKDVGTLILAQIGNLYTLLDPLNDEQACYRFGPEEWSIKQMVGHLADVERVWSYRLMCISRNDQTPLPGFESEDYVEAANFDERSLPDLMEEFEYLRRATIFCIANLTEEMVMRRGTASGYPVSARALIYMIPGHVEHHIESLKVNYMPGVARLVSS